MSYITKVFSALTLVCALCGIASLAYAQEVETVEFTIVAEVSVFDASVVQEQNTLTASFIIANGADTVQSDIRYGMELWSVSAQQGEASIRVHTAVADETIALAPGEVRAKAITATIPTSLSGLYRVSIVAETLSGMPLGRTSAGFVQLEETAGGSTVINQSTCYTEVSGGDTAYSTRQGVDVTATETLTMTCDVVHSGGDTTLTPLFVTTERSLYGEEVGSDTGTSVSLTEGVQEVIFTIPTPLAPQAYDTTVTLYDASSAVSNTASIHYVVQGASATIQNITLDNTTYQEGDTATASLFVTGIAGAFPDARNEAGSLSNPTLVATLESVSGIACAEPVSTSLTELEVENTAFVDVSFAVTRTCPDATVSLEVKDDSGVLASHTAVTMATPEAAGPASAIAIIVLVVIAGVVIFIVTRADKKLPTAAIMIVVVSAMFVWGGGVEAYKYKSTKESMKVGGTSFTAVFKRIVLSTTDVAIFTLQGSINRKEYNPGENVLVDASIRSSVCNNTSSEVGMGWAVNEGEIRGLFTQTIDNSDTKGYGCQNSAGWCNIHETAAFDQYLVPSPGEHNARFAITGFALHEDTGHKETIIGNILIPFTVIAPPDPVASLNAQPNIVFEGDSTLLTWTSANVASCVAESNPPVSGWEGSVTADMQDSMIVGPLALVDPPVYLFSISCINDENEIVEDSVQVFVEEKTLPECSDGAENDGDGWIDEEDPGCINDGIYDPNDDNESNDSPACSDGSDNDDDNQIDAADPGCSNGNDPDESDEPTEPEDDGDDTADPGDGGDTGDTVDPDEIDFSEF